MSRSSCKGGCWQGRLSSVQGRSFHRNCPSKNSLSGLDGVRTSTYLSRQSISTIRVPQRSLRSVSTALEPLRCPFCDHRQKGSAPHARWRTWTCRLYESRDDFHKFDVANISENTHENDLRPPTPSLQRILTCRLYIPSPESRDNCRQGVRFPQLRRGWSRIVVTMIHPERPVVTVTYIYLCSIKLLEVDQCESTEPKEER